MQMLVPRGCLQACIKKKKKKKEALLDVGISTVEHRGYKELWELFVN